MIRPEETKPPINSSSHFISSPFYRLTYLILIIIVGFALRVTQLNQLPLSLSLDEATNGLDALLLFRLAWLTPFLQNNFGRETAFFYLQGLALRLYGLSFFSLRFASVVAGTLTIPLLYVVGQRLQFDHLFFHKNSVTHLSALRPLNRLTRLNLTGLLAATGLAVSYWHVFFSRLALRAILLPPLLLGLVWCFWRGWFASPDQPRRRIWLVLAGFLLGLIFYTYLAARLLPFLFIIFVVIEFVRNKGTRIHQFSDFLILATTASFVATPLAVYFQQNPQAFGSRIEAISILATDNPFETLRNNLISLLHIHFSAGTWLGEWPAPNLVSVAGLLLGLLVCLYSLKKPAILFLLLWGGLGLTPVLLSTQDWTGRTTLLRGIVAWPALFLISAIGLLALANLLYQLANKISSHRPTHLLTRSPAPLVLIMFWGLLLFGSLTTVYQYFFIWASDHYESSDHPAQIATYLNRQTDQLTLIPLKFYAETVTNFLVQAHYQTLTNLEANTLSALLASNRPIAYLLPYESSGESVLVLLVPTADGQGIAYLLPPLTQPQVEALASHAQATPAPDVLQDSEQEPIAQIYPLPPTAAFWPLLATPATAGSAKTSAVQQIRANFNQDILLTGYRVEPATIKPGETVVLDLYWQAQPPVDGDYYLFIHLFNILNGQRHGQLNVPLTGILFDAHRWQLGLTVPDTHSFTLPIDAPEGAYRFEIGLYHASNQKRLPVTIELAPATQHADDKVILGKFYVWRQPPAPPQIPLTELKFDQNISLIGLDLPATTFEPGQSLKFTLHWQANGPILQDYTVFTHLLDSRGNLRAQQDNTPQQGRYPTSWWDSGEIIVDPYIMLLPPELEPGQYTLRVGLYQPQTGERLSLENGWADFVDLPGSITIQN